MILKKTKMTEETCKDGMMAGTVEAGGIKVRGRVLGVDAAGEQIAPAVRGPVQAHRSEHRARDQPKSSEHHARDGGRERAAQRRQGGRARCPSCRRRIARRWMLERSRRTPTLLTAASDATISTPRRRRTVNFVEPRANCLGAPASNPGVRIASSPPRPGSPVSAFFISAVMPPVGQNFTSKNGPLQALSMAGASFAALAGKSTCKPICKGTPLARIARATWSSPLALTVGTGQRPGSKSIAIAYVLKGVQPFHIRRIEISGNTKTRDKVIRRELELQEQQRFSGTKLRRSQASTAMLR